MCAIAETENGSLATNHKVLDDNGITGITELLV